MPKSCLTTADNFLLCMCCNFIVHNIHVIDYAGYLSVHVFLCTLIPLWTVVVDVMSTVHVLLGSEISYTGLDRAAKRYCGSLLLEGRRIKVRSLYKMNYFSDSLRRAEASISTLGRQSRPMI